MPDTSWDEMTGAREGDDVRGRAAHHQGLAEGPAGPAGAICHPSNAGVTPLTQTVPSQNSQLLIHLYKENSSSSFPFSDSPRVEEKKSTLFLNIVILGLGKAHCSRGNKRTTCQTHGEVTTALIHLPVLAGISSHSGCLYPGSDSHQLLLSTFPEPPHSSGAENRLLEVRRVPSSCQVSLPPMK